ncbi:hypothetical protein SAMN05446935_4443 [Burkholderia sp. YR290]|jgi:hypothetical protein|nr:hypothetical protein SAMN05192544_1004130 [Paraburkholderia hospita]SKD00923.1 hypothetical protein SAMN05445504_8230 [Burkholderia sp. CF099]SKD01287.1 hypothetical protein SAMN05446934_8473 [Paraburkholderia hospita]SOE84020.1 hypothetical protein SAMN05446935_4443 [Burkholderia sp. YR290]
MKPCDACKALAGKPSSAPPHGDLSAMGSDARVSPASPAERYDEYRCTVCGNWMLRNTPGIWSLRNPSGASAA